MTEAILNLGSSLGNKRINLKLAVRMLDALPHSSVSAISRIFASPPMGPCHGSFLNISIVLQTRLLAEDLLERCQIIEMRLGRLKGLRWSDRLLDIDILFYGQERISTSSLTVPHPEILERGFAYKPTLEIRPDLLHPTFNAPLENLLNPLGWPAWPVGVLSLAVHH